MRKSRWFVIALATVGIAPLVHAADPSQADLAAQIEALKARISQLEQNQQQQITRQDIDATVRAVMKDADERSHVMGSSDLIAGWKDGRFIIGSADGNYLLHPYFQLQARNVTTFRSDGKQPNDTDDTQNGFELRRLKFGFDGNVFTKDLTYAFQFAVDRHNGNTALEDAYARYHFADNFAIKAGQFKDTFTHESLLSSRKALVMERSYTNDFFSPGDNYVQGVSLNYDPHGAWHADVTFHDGSKNGVNQNFQDFSTNNADYGGAARGEYLVMGDWKNYDDYSAMGTKTDLLVLGAAVDYTEAGDTGVFLQTLDAQYENPNGFAAYAAFYGGNIHNNPIGIGDAIHHADYNWGGVIQASYLFSPKWELYGRYGYLNIDDNGTTAHTHNEVNEITVGGNYYIHGNNAKITADVGWLPNGAPLADDGAGILANHGPEYYLRVQFQLLL